MSRASGPKATRARSTAGFPPLGRAAWKPRPGHTSSRRTRCPRLAIAAHCATPASSRPRPPTGVRAGRAVGANGASLKDAISQSSRGAEPAGLLATPKQQNDIIGRIAAQAYHLANGIGILLRDAAASRRHPITHSSV